MYRLLVTAAALAIGTGVATAQTNPSPTPTQPAPHAQSGKTNSSDNMKAGSTTGQAPAKSERKKGQQSLQNDPTAKPTEPSKRVR